MKLYYKGTDREVKKGDVLTDFRGDTAIAYYWKEPTHGEGKISIKTNVDDLMSCGEYYVSVYDLEWREEASEIRQKAIDSINAIIREDFDTEWWMEDFLEAWKKAKGIEEEDELTDDQWIEFDADMHEPGLLRGFREVCIQEINERISYLF